MALDTRWIYPPGWDNSYPAQTGFRKGTVYLTADDEEEGEEDSTKIALAGLLTVGGAAATRMAIETIFYHVTGYDQIRLFFDDEDDTTIAILPEGNGSLDFCAVGGFCSPHESPTEQGDTGDLKMTASLPNGNLGSYTIAITVRPKD